MAAGDLTKLKLWNSTDGRNIKVTATATPGTLLHTADASALDEVTLWACNTSASPVKLTIEWGGVTSPDDLMEITIEGEVGWVLIVDGFVVTNGLAVRAFAATTAVININGFVNRIE